MKSLLDKAADVNALEDHYCSTLQAASALGHEQTVKLLLDNGADVNLLSKRHGSALQAASVCGHWLSSLRHQFDECFIHDTNYLLNETSTSL